MNIYEIDRAIEELIASSTDPETGELILDAEQLDALQMERETKIENIALYIKNTEAFAADLKHEEESLKDRRRKEEARAKRLKEYLMSVVSDKKFTTARVVCTFRESSRVEPDAEFVTWAKTNRPDLLRTIPESWEPNKDAIKAALKADEQIEHAAMVSSRSVTVK